MPRTTLADLAADGTVVIDGGMGTLLQERGLDDGGSGDCVDTPTSKVGPRSMCGEAPTISRSGSIQAGTSELDPTPL